MEVVNPLKSEEVIPKRETEKAMRRIAFFLLIVFLSHTNSVTANNCKSLCGNWNTETSYGKRMQKICDRCREEESRFGGGTGGNYPSIVININERVTREGGGREYRSYKEKRGELFDEIRNVPPITVNALIQGVKEGVVKTISRKHLLGMIRYWFEKYTYSDVYKTELQESVKRMKKIITQNKILRAVERDEKLSLNDPLTIIGFFLPIVESSWRMYEIVQGKKRPITSKSGAVGLWQLMRETAEEYGAKITNHHDDRTDIVKSTLVALRYLNNMYYNWFKGGRYNHLNLDSLFLAITQYNGFVIRYFQEKDKIDFDGKSQRLEDILRWYSEEIKKGEISEEKLRENLAYYSKLMGAYFATIAQVKKGLLESPLREEMLSSIEIF